MSTSEKLQTLLDDNKQSLTSELYNGFCILNMERHKEEDNNLYNITFFFAEPRYLNYNNYYLKFVQRKQILSLTLENVKCINRGIEDGGGININSTMCLDGLEERLCLNKHSILPLQRSECTCFDEDENNIPPDNSINTHSFIRISKIEKI
tara:strand:+ start:1555 stop:2007 length:453 start_codon:yes stop_codon:yes gene_type:complete